MQSCCFLLLLLLPIVVKTNIYVIVFAISTNGMFSLMGSISVKSAKCNTDVADNRCTCGTYLHTLPPKTKINRSPLVIWCR